MVPSVIQQDRSATLLKLHLQIVTIAFSQYFANEGPDPANLYSQTVLEVTGPTQKKTYFVRVRASDQAPKTHRYWVKFALTISIPYYKGKKEEHIYLYLLLSKMTLYEHNPTTTTLERAISFEMGNLVNSLMKHINFSCI